MTTGRPRDKYTEGQWREHVRDWRASGLSVRAFCERRGLAEPSFYAWRRKLARHADRPPAFVAVRLVADEAPARGAALEIVLARGRTVRVAPGFDAATLRRLLAVLEEGPPC